MRRSEGICKIGQIQPLDNSIYTFTGLIMGKIGWTTKIKLENFKVSKTYTKI